MFFIKKFFLERQLMSDIKAYVGVEEFPYNDAKKLSDLLTAYDKGIIFVDLMMLKTLDVLEKYPNLCDNWDSLMVKYKKQGLFPNWDVTILDD